MQSLLPTNKVPAPSAPLWAESHVAVVLDEHCYLLDDGRLARQAASCLLKPEVGDKILTVSSREGDNYIVHVLSRARDDIAQLSVPGTQELVIRQTQISLAATNQVSLHALRDVEVVAATGNLTLSARNLFATVHDTLVQTVRHYVGKAEQYLLDVRQLLKMHGQHALITAEQDIKVDSERISMG